MTINLPATADSDVAVPAPPSLWRGAAMNFMARVLSVMLGLSILAVVARQGPAVQGAFSLFVAIESTLLALGSGLGLLLAREAAQAQQPLARSRLRNMFAVGLAAGVCASLVLLAASGASARDPYRSLWLLALAAPFLLLAPTAIGLWMGQGRLIALNTVQVASPALALGALALAPAIGAAGLLGALGAWAVARTVVGLGTAGWALSTADTANGAAAPQQTERRDAVRFVAMVAVANVVSLANYRATLFVVERVEGLASAGVYSVAVQVAELLWLLSWAVTVSAYSSIGTRDAATAAAATLRAVRLGLGATLIVAPLVAFAAWLAVPALLGQEYRASLIPLFFLLPGVAAYSAASGLSAYYTQHRGLPHWAAGIAGLSLVMTLALAVWTVPRWGASGAAVATSLAYLVAIAVAFGIFLRDTGLNWTALWHDDRARMAGKT